MHSKGEEEMSSDEVDRLKLVEKEITLLHQYIGQTWISIVAVSCSFNLILHNAFHYCTRIIRFKRNL